MVCIARPHRIARSLALLALACAARGALADDTKIAGAADIAIRRVLLANFERRYPLVTEWTVTAVPMESQARDTASVAPSSIEVLHLGARTAVRATWRRAGEPVESRTLWYLVQGMQPVRVATREFTSGAPLAADAFSTQPRDVMALGCEPFASAASLETLRARRLVRIDHALCREDVEPVPAVARGEPVTVRYVSARIALTATAIAQQDAALGQRLRVVNPISHDSFTAVVTAAREVTVNE